MEFLMNLNGPILYIIIFIAKTVEVSMATIRTVFNSKGERFRGAFLGFFEVLIWILVVSSVLNNITEDPFKIIAYAAGFSLGNYLGVYMESKIALGIASIQVVVNEEMGNTLADVLRDDGYGVTKIEGEGKAGSKKKLLFIQLKRKKSLLLLKRLKRLNPLHISVSTMYNPLLVAL